MKIKVFGDRGPLNIAARFERAFVHLGCELSENPDVVYHCNGFYNDAEEFCYKLEKKPKKIYTLLDVDINKLIDTYSDPVKHLNSADEVCAISEFVKGQMQAIGVTKEINVIGFPVRPVSDQGKDFSEREIDGLYIGRLYSKSKRFVILSDIIRAGLEGRIDKLFVVAGTEIIDYQNFLLSPSDDNLNQLYNNSKFVINTSSFEGLGLSPIEGVICGCYPIVMNDNKVIYELGLEEFSCDPTSEAILAKMKDIEDNLIIYEGLRFNLANTYREKYNILTIAKKVLELCKKSMSQ